MAQVKKKSKVVSPEKLRELADESMAIFTTDAKARYDKAHKLYEEQDDATQDALDRMTTLLCRIARRNMWVSAGEKSNRLVLQIPEQTIYHNMFYMSVEIVKDLALFDVKIAGFKFSDNLCVECYKNIKPKRPKKKGGK